MTLLTIFNAVIPVPIILQGDKGGNCNEKNAIAILASIAIVGVLIMLISFIYYTVKCYCKHRTRPDFYRFSFFDIWNDVSESVVFWLGALFVLAMLLIAIVALVYGFLMAKL